MGVPESAASPTGLATEPDEDLVDDFEDLFALLLDTCLIAFAVLPIPLCFVAAEFLTLVRPASYALEVAPEKSVLLYLPVAPALTMHMT